MKVDLNLWEWLMKAQTKLNGVEYLTYQQLLFAWLANDRNPVTFHIGEMARDVGIDRPTFGAYIQTLQRKRWVKESQGFNRETMLQWCRTSLDERVPTPHAPGVQMKKPDGTIVRIPVSQFAEFEKKHGLRKQTIEYINRKIRNGKRGQSKCIETGELWEVVQIYDYEFSSYPYSELFGQTKQQRAKANNWNAA
ncbi:MAG: hypothetical protein ACO3NK_06015 [Prochlorotrichaceae cyanobacterium]